MKTTSEVCELFGITRKTLRGYADIGLVLPTEKTEAGYWLYDDVAVKNIAFIQILSGYGCKRKEIKENFYLEQIHDKKAVLKKVKDQLEKKMKNLDEKIKQIDIDIENIDQ